MPNMNVVPLAALFVSLVRTLLVLLVWLIGGAAHGDALGAAREFVREELSPMLKGREKFAKVRVARGPHRTAHVTIESRDAGAYVLKFDPAVSASATAAPEIDLASDRRLRGRIEAPAEWRADLARIMANVRRTLRADPYLHPTNRPGGAPIMPSPPQLEVLKILRLHQARARAEGRAQRSLILMPPGTGKTVVAGLFAEELETREEDILVVYVVQSNELLDQATDRFSEILGFSASDVRRHYGGRARGALDERTKLVAASRTVLHADLDKFMEEVKDRPGRIVYVLDEAHHIGRANGEFHRILTRLDGALRPRDVLLGLTATPWHTDAGPIHKFFHDNVAAAFVSATELARYLGEGRLVEMARQVFFRAMAEGYVSPIHEYRRVDFYGTGRHLTRAYLRDTEVQVEKVGKAERLELFRRTTHVHEPFVKKMIEEIRRTITHQDGSVVYHNRGLIFVPGIAHAEAYARLMNELAPKSDGIVARAYHSDLHPDLRKEHLDWFNADGPQHKYLIVIDTLGEGYDLPGINHVMLAKPYGKNDLVGMRKLLQHLGRAARIGSYKTRLWITDFTGDMERLIFAGLDESLVESAFTAANRPDIQALLGRLREFVTKIDRRTMKFGRFEAEDVAVPGGELAGGPKEIRRWTLARLLLDPSIMGKLIPQPKFTRGSLADRSMAEFLCAHLREQMVIAYEDEYPMILTLLAGLGLHDAKLKLAIPELRATLLRACENNAFQFSHDRHSPNPPDRSERVDALIEFAPDIFGREVEVTDADLRTDDQVLCRGPLIPWAWRPDARADAAAWTRPWTLAELLLHPSVPGILGLKGPSLAMMLLADDDFDGLPAGTRDDWRGIAWRDALARANDRRMLWHESASYLFDAGYRRRAIEALITIKPELFGRLTAWSDATLRAHALRDRPSTRRRAQVSSFLFLAGHDTSYVDADEVDTTLLPSLRAHDEAALPLPVTFDWHQPWTAAHTFVHPWASLLTPIEPRERDAPEHAIVIEARRRDLVPGDLPADDPEAIDAAVARLVAFDPNFFGRAERSITEEKLVRFLRPTSVLDDDRHAALVRYLRRRGPLPTLNDIAPAPAPAPPPPVAETPAAKPESRTEDWTLARFLMSAHAYQAFTPSPYLTEAERTGRTFGEVICEALGSPNFVAPPAVQSVLVALGLDRSSLRTHGWESALARACRLGLLTRTETAGKKSVVEGQLTRLDPKIFATRVRYNDKDAAHAYPFARGPVIPELAPPPRTGAERRRWTLARVLLDPGLTRALAQHRDNFAAEFARPGRGRGLPRLVRFHQSWSTELSWRLAAAAAHGLDLGPRVGERPGPAAVEARLIAFDPGFFGQEVSLSDADLLAYMAEFEGSKPNRFLLNWQLWRDGYDLLAAPPGGNANLVFAPLATTRGPRITTPAWLEPWTLARALLAPMHPGVVAELPRHAPKAARTLGVALVGTPSTDLNGFPRSTRKQNDWTHEVRTALSVGRLRAARDRGYFKYDVAADDEATRRELERRLIAFDAHFAQTLPGLTDETAALALVAVEATDGVRARTRAYLRSRGTIPQAPCEGWLGNP